MNKKLLTLGLVGLGAWWFYRKYSDAEYYLMRVDSVTDGAFFGKVDYVVDSYFSSLNFGESIGMQTSLVGIAYIKDWEGTKRNAAGEHIVYKDSAGYPTIGYGHLIKRGESFTTLSEDEAVKLLSSDLIDAENVVNKALKIQVHQFMYDAMVAFAFNWPKFGTSKCLKKINLGDFDGAFIEWREVISETVNGVKRVNQGLVNRRNKEILLFKEGLKRLGA